MVSPTTATIAFARIIGYEMAYDGLCWISVVKQRRLSDDELPEKMNAALKSAALEQIRVAR